MLSAFQFYAGLSTVDLCVQVGAPKINLAKLVGHLPSESDDGGETF